MDENAKNIEGAEYIGFDDEPESIQVKTSDILPSNEDKVENK